MTDTMTAHEHVLEVPGARIAYSVRGDLASCTPDRPALLLFGSPMDSGGFQQLADAVGDRRVVVTYDPRNTGRSERDDPAAPVTAEQHAEDLHALVGALGGGPVDLFGTSGGAVNALTLVAAHPGDARVLVAHEPPAAWLLPDAAEIRVVTDDIVATYDRSGNGPAMARFIALVMHRGPVTREYLDRPAPDPSVFGLPAVDDGSRDNPLVANLRGGGTEQAIDLGAVAAAPTRVVVGVGEESGGPEDGEMAVRGGYAVAAALGVEPVVFPGGHGGFTSGPMGPPGKPEEFAATLLGVLDGDVAR